MTDASPRPMKAMTYINAAGPWAGEVARMVGIGLGTDMMSVPIPIVPRYSLLFCLVCLCCKETLQNLLVLENDTCTLFIALTVQGWICLSSLIHLEFGVAEKVSETFTFAENLLLT